MVWMRFWVIAWMLAGCNQVFSLDNTKVSEMVDADTRPDRDEDGIADVEDPCISPHEEATTDRDEDGIADRVDACPFTPGATADTDGDGIPNPCDPYPTLAGDRHRCSMTFQNRPLNATLWTRRPRMSAMPAEIIPLTGLLVVFGSGEGVAIEDILGSAPAIEVDIPIGVSYANQAFVVGAFVGAHPNPGERDVACEIRNNGGAISVSLVSQTRIESPTGKLPQITDNATQGAPFDLRVYVQPTRPGNNVSCVLIYEDVDRQTEVLVAAGRIEMPIGRFGLYGESGFFSFFGLDIFERSDMPPLPQ